MPQTVTAGDLLGISSNEAASETGVLAGGGVTNKVILVASSECIVVGILRLVKTKSTGRLSCSSCCILNHITYRIIHQ